jgi:hypothetical protein
LITCFFSEGFLGAFPDFVACLITALLSQRSHTTMVVKNVLRTGRRLSPESLRLDVAYSHKRPRGAWW